MLTGKNASWKIRYKILRIKSFKKNIEPHQNVTGFYKKGVEVLNINFKICRIKVKIKR